MNSNLSIALKARAITPASPSAFIGAFPFYLKNNAEPVQRRSFSIKSTA
jgi:hypothetical protein